MITKRLASTFFMMSLCATAFAGQSPSSTPSPATASDQYCGKLAQIGASAWRTRADGYPINRVIDEVDTILSTRPQTREDAHEVIVAIYADKSVSSPQQAYTKVYDDCKQ